MIIGIGCDIVENARFIPWASYSHEKLLSILSESEILQVSKLGDINQKAQFLASRFAAKEAFYKALSNALISLDKRSSTIPFAQVRKLVSVEKNSWGVPNLKVSWKKLELDLFADLSFIRTHLSLSHEKSASCAFVIFEKVS